jgi:methyl-accepting chemotaxis protein
MVENMPLNVLFCDPDLVIRYANPASQRNLRSLEQFLPIRVDELIGQSIDIFHQRPAHQRRILADHRALPHEARFQIGPEHIVMSASAIYDGDGDLTGYMASFSITTAEVAAAAREQERTAEMERVLEQVAHYSSGVASASTELTSISQHMAANAEETSAQASVVAATSDQMSASTSVVSHAMDEIRSGIAEVARNASEASRVATQAVEAARASNEAVRKLADSSHQIGNVVEVISSIAEETNLLALNATIEAARAGEAGKGFAVVANEVKELASETGRATGDIKRQIDAIQADTRAAIEAIGRIGDIIQTISDAQHSIAIVVEEQTASATEMARNVADVSNGSAAIVASIGGVAEAAQSTSIGASQTESAASELAQMASELQRIVASSGQAETAPTPPTARTPQSDVAAKLAAALR